MSRSQVHRCLSLHPWLSCVALTVAVSFTGGMLNAQQVDHYSSQSLMERAESLKAKAAGNHGAAAETLQKYGVDYTMLSYRNQDGGAEMHASFADIFVVVEGEATLLSGGELENKETVTPGEFRGTNVSHGTSTHMGKGDVVHIPPNTPHRLLISKGTNFVYFVIKVKEGE